MQKDNLTDLVEFLAKPSDNLDARPGEIIGNDSEKITLGFQKATEPILEILKGQQKQINDLTGVLNKLIKLLESKFHN